MTAELPSGSTILQHCAEAYDSLAVYSCHTYLIDPVRSGQLTAPHADIQFIRPNLISIKGTTVANEQYSIEANGKSIVYKSPCFSRRYDDFERPLGSITGVGMSTGTIIPALLLRTTWGYPFNPIQSVANDVPIEVIEGHPCYMVTVTWPIRRIFWVDTESMLICKVETTLKLFGKSSTNVQIIRDSFRQRSEEVR